MPAVLELLKPGTWLVPMWAFVCGLHSTTGTSTARWSYVIGGLLLTGPLVCGMSQAVNDWFDRHVDAINAPSRPIPSGRLPGRLGLYIAVAWTILSLFVARWLGSWVLTTATVGVALAWAYSAPPLRLKRNGWIGNAVVALCYDALPWIAGAALVSGGGAPSWRILAIAALYSVGAHGIMTLHAVKSVVGDRQMGIRSLPVLQGEFNAVAIACFFMALPQIGVVVLLGIWGHYVYATLVAALLFVQLFLMDTLLDQHPRDAVPWYSGIGVGLYMVGMLVAAFALRLPG
jgi:chlorophyll synthase